MLKTSKNLSYLLRPSFSSLPGRQAHMIHILGSTYLYIPNYLHQPVCCKYLFPNKNIRPFYSLFYPFFLCSNPFTPFKTLFLCIKSFPALNPFPFCINPFPLCINSFSLCINPFLYQLVFFVLTYFLSLLTYVLSVLIHFLSVSTLLIAERS